MRRTAEQRRQHMEFAEHSISNGYQPADAARQLCGQFGLTPRQARYDVRTVLWAIDAEGDTARRGKRQAEDLALMLRRFERIYRDAMRKNDHRAALKVEKARGRLLGLYAPARQTPEVIEDGDSDALREQAIDVHRAQARRKLRKACTPVAETASVGQANEEQPANVPDHERGMRPPMNLDHRANCPCWRCNPKYKAEDEESRRYYYKGWLRQQREVKEELATIAHVWRGREDHETDEQFTARVRRAADLQRRLRRLNECDFARRQPPKVERRLAILTKWLELGIRREMCRRRYRERFKLSPRRLRAEWDLCLRRFQDEGRYLLRRRNEALAFGLALRRRDMLAEHCLTAGDYKLALDVEIDRCRLLGLHPKERREEPEALADDYFAYINPAKSDDDDKEEADPNDPAVQARAEANRVALLALDRLDPAGRGTPLPTAVERVLVEKLG